jgi:hypothetical protein
MRMRDPQDVRDKSRLGGMSDKPAKEDFYIAQQPGPVDVATLLGFELFKRQDVHHAAALLPVLMTNTCGNRAGLIDLLKRGSKA